MAIELSSEAEVQTERPCIESLVEQTHRLSLRHHTHAKVETIVSATQLSLVCLSKLAAGPNACTTLRWFGAGQRSRKQKQIAEQGKIHLGVLAEQGLKRSR